MNTCDNRNLMNNGHIESEKYIYELVKVIPHKYKIIKNVYISKYIK